MAEWKAILKKCYGHVELRLWNKTLIGAHCEQRLGMPASDYYVGNALKAIYEQSWEWQYEKYTITVQLTRIINSMISNEVRKYKVEQKQNKQLPLLIQNDRFDTLMESELIDETTDAPYFERCVQALQEACLDNSRHQQFVKLKIQGKSYSEIADDLHCSLDDAYQIMENIARRARKILQADK